MTRYISKVFTALLLLTSSVAFSAEKLPVLASFSILADVARQVGGERVDVRAIVGVGVDAHGYSLTPTDVRKIRAAKLLLVNGLGFESAAMMRAMRDSKVPLAEAAYGLPVRIALGGHHHHHDHDDHAHHHHHDHDHEEHNHGGSNIDPHIWQDPVLMQGYAKNIAMALSKADPAGKAYYAKRLASYQQQLRSLNTWIEQQFKGIDPSQRVVLTVHDAFGYFGQRYQVQFAFLQGASGDSQTSAKTMARLVKFIQEKKARAVFMENARDPRLVQQLSQEAGVPVRQQKLYADALGKSHAVNTYITLMQHNVKAITSALHKGTAH